MSTGLEPIKVLPQETDYLDMATYAAHRNKLFLAEKMVNKYPEIFSWCDIVIRPAISPHDYDFEPQFSDWAIYVDWAWTETGCNKISCHSRGPGFDCTADSTPLAFRSGDTTWTACEPSCYFRNDLPPENIVGTHSLPTHYYKGRCYWVMEAIHAWMTDPTVRSTVKYVKRVNTLATGFDVSYESDSYDVPTIKGRINKYYCDAFFQKLKNNDCEEPWWSDVLGYTFMGQSLVKFLQQGVHPNAGTRDQISLTPDTTNISSYLLQKQEWKMHINKEFKVIQPNVLLSDLGFTALMLSQQKRGHYIFHNKAGILERFLFYESVENATNRTFSRNKYLQILSPLQRQNKDNKYNQNAAGGANHSKRRHRRDLISRDGGLDWDSIGDRLSTTASTLLHMFIQKDFYIQVGTDISWSILKQKLGPAFKELLGRAFNTMGKILKNTSVRLIDTVAGHLMGHIAADLLVEFSAKFVIMMSKLAVAGASVIGIIADIALALDLLVMVGWDPLGLQNQLDSNILDMLREQATVARYKTGDPNCEIDPQFFTKFIMKENVAGTSTDDDTKTVPTKNETQFSYAHPTYSENIKSYQQETLLKRPKIYSDQLRFQVSSLSDYLNGRTSNSLGQRYDWDSDIVSNLDDELARYEIYTHFIPRSDLKSYAELINARQHVTVIIIIILSCFISLSLINDWFKPILFLIALPLIWILSYVRFSNNELHNRIWENLYRKYLR